MNLSNQDFQYHEDFQYYDHANTPLPKLPKFWQMNADIFIGDAISLTFLSCFLLLGYYVGVVMMLGFLTLSFFRSCKKYKDFKKLKSDYKVLKKIKKIAETPVLTEENGIIFLTWISATIPEGYLPTQNEQQTN